MFKYFISSETKMEVTIFETYCADSKYELKFYYWKWTFKKLRDQEESTLTLIGAVTRKKCGLFQYGVLRFKDVRFTI